MSKNKNKNMSNGLLELNDDRNDNGALKMTPISQCLNLKFILSIMLLCCKFTMPIYASSFEPTAKQNQSNPTLSLVLRDIYKATKNGKLLPESLRPSVDEMERVLRDGPDDAITYELINAQPNINIKGKNLRNAFINLMQFANVSDPNSTQSAAASTGESNPTRKFEQKRVALAPLGHQFTGKSLLLNMANLLSIYHGKEQLDNIETWFDQQYPEKSIRINPFADENERSMDQLDSELDAWLKRFFEDDQLRQSCQNASDDKILMPTVDKFKLRTSHTRADAISGHSNTNDLYDTNRGDRVWDLVTSNWAGNSKISSGKRSMANATHFIDYAKIVIENDGSGFGGKQQEGFGKHVLLHMPAYDLPVDDDERNEQLKMLIDTVKYIDKYTKLPVLLAITYANEAPSWCNKARSLVEWLQKKGVNCIGEQDIFYFEFGGMSDIELPDSNTQSSLLLYAGLAKDRNEADGYVREVGKSRNIALGLKQLAEQKPDMLTRMSKFLRYRMSKNFAMLHKLLGRIYELEKRCSDPQEWNKLIDDISHHQLFLKVHKESTKFSIHKEERKIDGIRNLENLEANKVHFIRLCEEGRSCSNEVYSYDMELENPSDRQSDKIFHESDLPDEIRNSNVWTPINNPVEHKNNNGLITKNHGSLLQVQHRGWIRNHTANVPQETIIRNFLCNSVKKKNKLTEQSKAARKDARDLQANKPVEGQTGWLILNADLAQSEITSKNVHQDQQDELKNARTDNLKSMILHFTKHSVESDDELNSFSLVIPVDKQHHVSVKEDGSKTSYWVYSEALSKADFEKQLSNIEE